MNSRQPEAPSLEEMEQRKRVWERIKKTAQVAHNHPQDHGINTVIAADAGRSSQTVGDWKHGRTPVPPSVIAALAAKYKVSIRYLAAATDDPHEASPPDEGAMTTKMLELVEQAIERARPDHPIDGVTGARMSARALDLLRKGEQEASIVGRLIYIAEGRGD